ncbi:MAG TPA: T9SS type A sorting domain-containing protein, partial [Bacteroidales bacterium]|nr:T9SS type A sorting domain-containing protein [Bacteroidales bacterium]
AVKNVKQNASFIYPNPAKNILYVSAKAGKEVKIYNVAGSLVFSRITASNIDKIDISKLPAGVYFVKVDNLTEKLLVK